MTTGPDSPLLVFCTCPDDATAETVAATLVSQRLAACVTRLPAATSTYRWKGEVQHDAEVLLLIKTTPTRYPALEKTLIEVHPYELPEILAVPVTTGLPAYLTWIEESTTS